MLSDHVHVLDLKAMIEDAGYEELYGTVDKHFSKLGYYRSAKAINEWINGSWRSTSAATPPDEASLAMIRCSLIAMLLCAMPETFSSPSHRRLDRST